MAREVLLRLRARNYERALQLAERVKKRAEKTLATGKALREELKGSLSRARDMAELRRRTAALGRRGQAASQRDVAGLQRARFERALGPVGRAREIGEAGASLLSGRPSVGSLVSGIGQFVPGAGAFSALMAPLIEKLEGYLDERLEKRLRKHEAALSARLEEDRFRTDFTRRFKEDPAFAAEQAKKAFRETLAEEKALGKRIHRSIDLISEFDL